MFGDAALLLTYLVAGAFPVAYNYAIARRLAKRYNVKVISSNTSAGDVRESSSDRKSPSSDVRLDFKVENVTVREGRIYLNLVLDEASLVKLFSIKGQ